MEKFKDFINNPWVVKTVWAIVAIIAAAIIYKIITDGIIKKIEKGNNRVINNKKAKTYIKLLNSIIRYVFILGVGLIVLQIYGVNVSTIIAGVGLFGVIFGLAIQDWLKDIIRGSSILSDNYFAVGDVVKYKDVEGKVLVLGLKTTKIQDLKNNNIISIANRNIDEVELVSNNIFVKIPLPYEVSVSEAEEVIKIIITTAKKYKTIDDCEYIGVTELADSSIKYLLKITCNPNVKLQANRDALRSILVVLEKEGISVPYNQIDVHQK